MEHVSREELSNVPQQLLQKLLVLLGEKFVNKEICEDGIKIKSLYKDAKYLTNSNRKEFLSQRNQMVPAFIKGCCGFQYQQQHKWLMLYAVDLVVEMIYSIRNLNLVLPYCFY